MTFLYIDPGSMSFVVQMLVAGFVGFAYFFRKSFNRMLVFLRIRKKDKRDSEHD